MTPEELLATFHREIRLGHREDEPAPGIIQDSDGHVLRRYPQVPGASYAMVESPTGLGEDPDGVIARTAAFFTARNESVEWKTYGYDEPADLPERLSRAGFVGQDVEVLMLGESAVLVDEVALPDGVVIRELRADDVRDFERIAELMTLVWGRPDTISEALRQELAADPARHAVFVAEESPNGPVLCAAWLQLTVGTDFASLWGGSTHPQWRRRGLYRALVAARARVALERGYRFMRVDTSPDSRPILTRLGLHQVATTTPYVLPSAAERVRTSFDRQGLMTLLGAELTDVTGGTVTIEVPRSEHVTQQEGFFHAGVTTSIADSACGYAALSLLPPGREVRSVQFTVNLLAPARGERLVARAHVVRSGRTISVCQADVVEVRSDGAENLVAVMTATMFAVTAPG